MFTYKPAKLPIWSTLSILQKPITTARIEIILAAYLVLGRNVVTVVDYYILSSQQEHLLLLQKHRLDNS